jgi:hypothetical protein
MRVVLLFSLGFLFSTGLFAQARKQSNEYYIKTTQNKEQTQPVKVGGNPYLNRQFQKSYISKKNGVEIKDMFLRYNIYSDNMEFKQPDGTIMEMTLPGEIKRINLNGTVFVYTNYLTPKNTLSGFFEVLFAAITSC